jgi:hypothetical protein
MQEIYIQWIKGSTRTAFDGLIELLERHKSLSDAENLRGLIFFRGRKEEKPLTLKGIYHIPFNERYLISNQRYSVSGQPLLYLGLSPLDVVRELRGNIHDFTTFQFSTYSLQSAYSLRILDLANPFPVWFDTVREIARSGAHVDLNDTSIRPNVNDIPDIVYRYLLTNVCSFFVPSRKLSHFCEEYVIPQMLTEIARPKYAGIRYNSTRVPTSICYSKRPFYSNRYRENVALFTSYSSFLYDFALLGKFHKSSPMFSSGLATTSWSDVLDLQRQLLSSLMLRGASSLMQIVESTAIVLRTQFQELLVQNSHGGFSPYFNHPIGQLHLNLIGARLRQLLSP